MKPLALVRSFEQTAAGWVLAAALSSVVLAGCGRGREESRGVELVLGGPEPAPGMTFELRFDQVMARAGQIGEPTADSPLVIVPAIAGTFTWLSARSGTFTLDEPLALDTRYQFSLRPGLKAADGRPLEAVLRRSLTTPAFDLTGFAPSNPSTNAFSEPEVRLTFNAGVRAAEAARFLEFRNAAGRRIAADTRQGTVEERSLDYDLSVSAPVSAWQERFAQSGLADLSRAPGAVGTTEESAEEAANFIVATPRVPLSLGRGWRLVVGAGLPSVDSRLRLHRRAEVPIGDILPFALLDAQALNSVNSGASIWLEFSKALPDSLTNRFAQWLSITPDPTNLEAVIQGKTLCLRSGGFKSGTQYTLELRAGFPAAEAFQLQQPATAKVTLDPIPPRLYFPAFSAEQLAGGQRSFRWLAVNVPRVRVRAKLLDGSTAIYALRGYGSYFLGTSGRPNWDQSYPSGARRHASPLARGIADWGESYRALDYNLIPGRTVFDEELGGTSQVDAAQSFEVSWDRVLAGRKSGVVFIEAARAGAEPGLALGTQALIQLTDLGLGWKQWHDGVQAFVFSHSTGRAVEGATARLLSAENELLGEARTDASGLAGLGANTNAAWLAVQLGQDFHAVQLDRHKLWLWRFNVNYLNPFEAGVRQQDARRVMLFGDRELYRPGETLYLKGIVRDWGDSGLSIPAGLTGKLVLTDPRQRQFFQTNVQFNAFGAWSMSLQLPADGPRGSYCAEVQVGEGHYTRGFLVHDFQPNAFEITLSDRPAFAAGEKVEVPVSARYYFGKPLSRAQVKWSLEAEDVELSTKAFADFTFRRGDLDARLGRGPSSIALTGQGTLSASSNFVIAPEVPLNPVAPQPRSVSLLVEVTDLNQQTLSRRVEFTVHSSDFYVGLRRGAEVLGTGKPLALEAAAVRPDGQPWPEVVKARLTLQRIEWLPVRVQGAGRAVRFRNEPVFTNVVEQDIEIAPVRLPEKPGGEVQGRPLAGLAPTLPGQYLLEVKAQDPAGRQVVNSLDFTVAAPGELGWDYRDEVQVALKPDQATYLPGQAAEILVQTPISGTALVTVERQKILRSFLARLQGNAPIIRVPIEPGDAPNVFVAVFLVRGAQDCPRQVKEPDYRVGYCQLAVLDPQTRLDVTVQPGATNYLPAQAVLVNVAVKDAAGAPVSGAEVTLYAVDEGLLSLSDSAVPNPHAFFYEPRPLAIESSVSLPSLLPEDPEELHYQNKGYLGGGGGRDHPRKNFLACAFWHASLLTASDGSVSACFNAPDSLTRYRVVAVAHAGSNHFGRGQSAFQVTKPLVVEPALPNFANITDHILARGVVQNQTARTGEVIVTLELDDKARSDGPGSVGGAGLQPAPLARRVTVPANGSAVAEFPVEFVETGTARWTWKARFVEPGAGDFTDAVQSTLEVGCVAPLLRQCLTTRVAGGETDLLAGADPRLLAGRGTITVTLANTRLGALAEAASELLHYPYGCAEQTGSSLLPWIVFHDAPGVFGLLHCRTNQMESAIRSGVDRLLSMQTGWGGLGYWPGAKEPMLWASAYGGVVLALARRHGIEVPPSEFGRLMEFLSMQLASRASGQLADYPLALYALALAGRADSGYNELFYNLRDKLCPEDRALLALAVAEGGGPAEMTRELLASNSVARAQAQGQFGCPVRQSAIALLAWAHFQPQAPQAAKLADDLVREQAQGRWETTQANAWALVALADYFWRLEGTLPPVEARLLWAGQTLPVMLNEKTNAFTCALPYTNLAKPRLVLANASTHPLFGGLAIEARPPAARQPRQDRGLALLRTYQRLDDNGHPLGPEGLRVGDRILVTLRLSVRQRARFVAVDDALPSILEAVNPDFKTRQASLQAGEDGAAWVADFREIRQDRYLSFADDVWPGDYTLRYLARVRAAGAVTAPSAKAEEMYQPQHYGLSETQTLTSQAME